MAAAVVYRGAGPMAAASVGAVAVLVRSVGGADYPPASYRPHRMYDPRRSEDSRRCRDRRRCRPAKESRRPGPGQAPSHANPANPPRIDSYNVIADWKGSEHPEQVVVVSGHLDSWDLGTGAIDDGAGVVVSMQAIHLLHDLGIHPRRTVRFIAWMSEEEGSQGAAAYNGRTQGQVDNHIAAIETDLGADHPTGIYYAGKPELGQWLRPVAGVLDAIGARTLESTTGTGEDINGMT